MAQTHLIIRNSAPQRGMSLIELMVGLAILAVIAAIAVPSYHQNSVVAKYTEGLMNLEASKVAVGDYVLQNSDFSGVPGGILSVTNMNRYFELENSNWTGNLGTLRGQKIDSTTFRLIQNLRTARMNLPADAPDQLGLLITVDGTGSINSQCEYALGGTWNGNNVNKKYVPRSCL